MEVIRNGTVSRSAWWKVANFASRRRHTRNRYVIEGATTRRPNSSSITPPPHGCRGGARTDKTPWAAHRHRGDVKASTAHRQPGGDHKTGSALNMAPGDGGDHETEIAPHTAPGHHGGKHHAGRPPVEHGTSTKRQSRDGHTAHGHSSSNRTINTV